MWCSGQPCSPSMPGGQRIFLMAGCTRVRSSTAICKQAGKQWRALAEMCRLAIRISWQAKASKYKRQRRTFHGLLVRGKANAPH